jgi:hypothetical protein
MLCYIISAYKGITFSMSVQFLADTILVPLKSVKKSLSSAWIIYDEMNEIDKNGNSHIMLLCDFDDHKRNIFYLNTRDAIVACYSNAQINKGMMDTLTAYEKTCYKTFHEQVGKTVESATS